MSLNLLVEYWEAAIVGVAGLIVFFIILSLRRGFVVNKTFKAIPKGQDRTIKLWAQGITQATLTAKKDLSNLKVDIAKTKPHTKNGAHYQTFEIKDNENASYAISFKVSKRWAKRNRVKHQNIRLAKLKEHEWKTTRSSLVGEDKNYLYYTAEVKSGKYTIRGNQDKLKPHKPVMAIVIGLVIVAAITVVTFMPNNTIHTVGIPAQYIPQDGQGTIKLDKYFHDPDGDVLSYTISSTEHIDVELIGQDAIIKPKAGWIGQGAVKFLAKDGKGGSVESNTVPVIITKQLITPHMTPYIVTIIGVLALIIILVGLRGLKKAYK